MKVARIVQISLRSRASHQNHILEFLTSQTEKHLINHVFQVIIISISRKCHLAGFRTL